MQKMGIHNRITAARYYKIKSECKSPADDCMVMQKYSIGQTTARRIRNTTSYTQYRYTSSTNRRKLAQECAMAEKRLEEIMAANPIPAERAPYESHGTDEQPTLSEPMRAAFVIVAGMFAAVIVILLAIWLISNGGKNQ